MSIATKTGDKGQTSLMYQRRVAKSHPRVEAVGSVDELGATLGLARATVSVPWIREQLEWIQHSLVTLMGELATDGADLEKYQRDGFATVGPDQCARLDALVAQLESEQRPFHGWAFSGREIGAAALDLSRATCRRAERRVCELESAPLERVVVYLNRLSDVLWLMARHLEAPQPS